jgi:hypothetical protein
MRTPVALPSIILTAATAAVAFATAAVAFATAAVAQVSPQSAAPAACAAEFVWATEFAARNYAGFETKTAGDERARYDALLGELRPLAAAANNPAECGAVLARWLAFFDDGHLSIGRRSAGASAAASDAPPGDEEIRARFADWPTRPLTEAQARSHLDALGAGRQPIEGIWESADGSYRGVVLRDEATGGRYSMSILRADSVWWMPGQIKAIFDAAPNDSSYGVQFFMRDHSEQAWEGRVRRNILVMGQGSTWFRQWPRDSDDVSREAYEATRNVRFAARDVAPGTVLLQLPSFNDPAGIDALFVAEAERIGAAERLIIDLRGNGGGSDYNYRALIPLIYTDPIRLVSNAALATEANIRVNEALVADTTIPAEIRAQLARSVAQMRTAQGGWYEFPDRVHEEEVVLDRPQHVAVLVDRGCASSCEQFLLAAKQSRKVTIYGTRTAGILDFGNVRSAQMPGGTLLLNYPTTRSKRLPAAPVDGTGILPHVPVPDDVIDPVAWVLQNMK